MAVIASLRRKRLRTMAFFGAATIFCLWQIGLVRAGESPDKSPDKSGYSLFRPTPDSLMREMATDRPDKTESAYTVDAGHFQFEIDLLSYAYDRSDAETVKALAIAPINMKIGVLNNVDLQLIAESYNVQRTNDRSTNSSTRLSGFGDLVLRCKTNLWGNDGGPTAMAVMPIVKLPTNQHGLGNGAVEGGIIFPFAMDLPNEWGFGTQAEVDFIQDSGSSDYHPEFINSVTVSHDIVGNLAGYVELYSNVSTESGAKWIATFDLGFTYAITRDIQLDAGVNIGLTDAADDLNPFIGLSMRY